MQTIQTDENVFEVGVYAVVATKSQLLVQQLCSELASKQNEQQMNRCHGNGNG